MQIPLQKRLTETDSILLPHPPMHQSNPDLILMNFKLPSSLKQEFQHQCKTHKLFMTSVLNDLIRNYLNQKTDQQTNENF